MTTKVNTTDFKTGKIFNTPNISSIAYASGNPYLLPAGGEVITITGKNFSSPKVIINHQSVSITSSTSTSISFLSPALASGTYDLVVVNSNGSTGYSTIDIMYTSSPTWVTSSGLLTTAYDSNSINIQLVALSDTHIANYTVTSGALPSGVTLSTSGLLSGNVPIVASDTTYSFTVQATDMESQSSTRSFSIIVKPETVTWTALSAIVAGCVEFNTTLTATTASGSPITYSSSNLPSGLTIVGNKITGTPTAGQNATNTTITATSVNSNKTADTTVSIQIVKAGQSTYLGSGTFTWVAPAGVTSVCAVCIGGGGGGHRYSAYARGGGGGGLGWKNDIAVVPGTSYTVVVGAAGSRALTSSTAKNAGAGGQSYFISADTVAGNGGAAGIYSTAAATRPAGGTYVGTGGGNGGAGGWGYAYAGGGGGAGGYTGAGGSGSVITTSTYGAAGNTGAGGGGGGGGSGGSTKAAGSGGGTGPWGQGDNGAGGAAYLGSTYNGNNGQGGSGGRPGALYQANTTTAPVSGQAGKWGGGGGGTDLTTDGNCDGAPGAVRIIWGIGRAFPSTYAADV